MTNVNSYMMTLKTIEHSLEEITEKTLNVLRSGGLVVSPSDTVYGLLVDATNEKAVKKLIDFKSRPVGKPISVFVSDFKMLGQNVKLTDHEKILGQLLPGPFTIVLESRHQTSKLLESESGTLGVRIPDYKFITDLVKQFGKPITATSANLSGQSSHYSIDALLNELPDSKKDLIDLIIDAGKLPKNKPSTVIDMNEGDMHTIRSGDLVLKNSQTFTSDSPEQTRKTAAFILKNILKKDINKSLTFIIEGELGAGKTVFVKGIGQVLGIDNIVSPTFVVYYEYPIKNEFMFKNLYHFDLYQLTESEEFKHLGIEKILEQKNILCIEWGEKAEEIIELLKKKSKIIYVKMKYVGETMREIEINF